MATQIKPEPKSVYDQDFYVWTEVQAELLRQRRFGDLDLDNLIQEVEGLGDTKKSAVLNNARVIIEHLLKLQHSPARPPARLGRIRSSTTGPGSSSSSRRGCARSWPKSCCASTRSLVAPTERKLRLYGEDAAAAALPTTCPYGVDQITGDWWP